MKIFFFNVKKRLKLGTVIDPNTFYWFTLQGMIFHNIYNLNYITIGKHPDDIVLHDIYCFSFYDALTLNSVRGQWGQSIYNNLHNFNNKTFSMTTSKTNNCVFVVFVKDSKDIESF